MFINTNEFTIVKKDDYPDRTSVYFDQYWDTMHNYCMNGYDVGGMHITGDHFFYLNFWKIYGIQNYFTGRKGIIKPRFTELDYERWNIFERMRIEKKDLLMVKGRQNGASETVACYGGKEFTFYPGSITVIVAGEQTYSEKTMDNVLRGLNDLVKTEFYKRRMPNRQDKIRAQFKHEYENEDGEKIIEYKGYMSEIYCLTAKDNPQTVSRLSPSLVIYEESAMWKKGLLKETHRFVKPSLKAEGLKTGYAIFIATGGESGDSIDEVEEMFFDPGSNGLLEFDASLYEDDNYNGKTAYFIPAWKFEILDTNGNIEKEKSIQSLLDTRSTLTGKDLFREITQKPFKPSEAFMIASGGFFGEDVITMFNERRSEIMKHKSLRDSFKRGDIFWILDDGSKVLKIGKNSGRIRDVEFVIKEDGPFILFEDPIKKDGKVPPGLYRAGTDSYDQDEAATSKSKGSLYIRKGFYDLKTPSKKFVAELNIRPQTADEFHEMTAKLCYLYNARNLIERLNLTIIKWYINNGFEYLLRERPELAIAAHIKDSQAIYTYGVDPGLKVYALKMLSDEYKLKSNIDKIDSLTQLNAFIKFRLSPKYNCDITVASAYAIMHEKEDEDLMMFFTGEEVQHEERLHYEVDNFGNLKMIG